jgi:cell division protein FtsQ
VLADAGFRVKHIEIDGAHDVPKARILQALDVKHGTPILDVSVSKAAARVAALGAVKQVAIERLLPDTLRVQVTERAPVAIWQTPHDRFALVAAGGAILAGQDAAAARARDPDLTLIVGAGAPAHVDALLAVLRRHKDVASRLAAAVRVDDLRWNLVLKDRTTIKLPSEHVGAALDRLETAQKRIALLDRPVATIDLRLADRLVVRPYPGTLRHPGADGEAKSGERSS